MATKFEVRKSSINYEGVFTLRPILKGAFVLRCKGIVRRGDELDDVSRIMQIGHDRYLVEDLRNPHFDDYLNHSCRPNVGFSRGTLALYALRHIPAESELLLDYSTTMNEPGWKLRCRCGVATCRKWIRSFCDLTRQEQLNLRRIALHYLRA